MTTVIQPVQDNQLERCLTINNNAAPNVNRLTIEQMRGFAEDADYFRVAVLDDSVAGFLIALGKNHDYDSPNFQWFDANYESFIYIDRVIVAPEFRGKGLGNIFYSDVQSFAEQRAEYLTCEVNLEPRNDVSLLFHGAQGFSEVGQQRTENDTKRVSLLAKPLPSFGYVRKTYGTEAPTPLRT